MTTGFQVGLGLCLPLQYSAWPSWELMPTKTCIDGFGKRNRNICHDVNAIFGRQLHLAPGIGTRELGNSLFFCYVTSSFFLWAGPGNLERQNIFNQWNNHAKLCAVEQLVVSSKQARQCSPMMHRLSGLHLWHARLSFPYFLFKERVLFRARRCRFRIYVCGLGKRYCYLEFVCADCLSPTNIGGCEDITCGDPNDRLRLVLALIRAKNIWLIEVGINYGYVQESNTTGNCNCEDMAGVDQGTLRNVTIVCGQFRREGGIPEPLERMFLHQ